MNNTGRALFAQPAVVRKLVLAHRNGQRCLQPGSVGSTIVRADPAKSTDACSEWRETVSLVKHVTRPEFVYVRISKWDA
jgi:hypothetical protein